jgi:hypothetical protein
MAPVASVYLDSKTKLLEIENIKNTDYNVRYLNWISATWNYFDEIMM